jgi:hypothetical protein
MPRGAKLTICACVTPLERQDGTCGACGLRRLGDDLGPRQTRTLAAVMIDPLLGDDRRELYVRQHGRKRQRSVRRA